MSKTARIEACIESDLKEAAEAVFRKLGLSPEQAIRLFYEEVECHQCLPFEAHIPNQETIEAIRELEEDENLPRYKNFAEYRKKLGV